MRFLLSALVVLACAALPSIESAKSCAIGSHSSSPPDLPDSSMTPGKPLSGITKADVCKAGYAKGARDVSQSVKNQIYKEYGQSDHGGWCATGGDGCEIDHLISLEIGGSNDPENLWPQPYGGSINAHMKDRLEDFLHKWVCYGCITLEEAQTAIRSNWISAYNKYCDVFSSKKCVTVGDSEDDDSDSDDDSMTGNVDEDDSDSMSFA